MKMVQVVAPCTDPVVIVGRNCLNGVENPVGGLEWWLATIEECRLHMTLASFQAASIQLTLLSLVISSSIQ